MAARSATAPHRAPERVRVGKVFNTGRTGLESLVLDAQLYISKSVKRFFRDCRLRAVSM